MNNRKTPELLAPAGNLAKLKYAINYGADAVYCGLPGFCLRVNHNQFDFEKLKKGIEFAHNKGKKVYLTVNVFAHNRHIELLNKSFVQIKDLNPNALIISDPGIISLIKQKLPDVPIHLSTQANCTNWQSAKFWYEQGVKRIILSREVTLEEIKQIHEKLPQVELEVFGHGAMCMAYSGRCMLSKYFTQRSANLGDCTQPCRWGYRVYLEEEKRPNQFIPVEQDQDLTYIFNSKDICLIKYLDQLQDAGVCSVKIEGRAKSLYYVANTVKCYRQALDLMPFDTEKKKKQLNELEKELAKAINRSFTTGFLFGKENCEQNIDQSHANSDYEFVGEIENKDGQVRIHNAFYVGDEIEVILPSGKSFCQTIKKIADYDTMEEMQEAHGGQEKRVKVEFEQEVVKGGLIRRRIK